MKGFAHYVFVLGFLSAVGWIIALVIAVEAKAQGNLEHVAILISLLLITTGYQVLMILDERHR